MTIPCIICGGEIKQYEVEARTCHFCGKKEINDLACSKGHYVCRRCHIDKKPKDEYGLPIWPGFKDDDS